MPIDTEKERDLSNQRKGARKVRSAIQQQIDTIKAQYQPEDTATEALNKLAAYIHLMIERDKKRKGGLWN